ncbi:MAG: F0F1 ATP synthase subunit epsilon [Clostridiales bacterium]
MSDKQISLDIVTPEKIVYSADVASIFAPATMGQIGLLPDHIAIVTGLGIGELRVTPVGGSELPLFISGGFLELKKNKAVILAKSAETSEEIDIERAKKAKARAEERLSKKDSSLDEDRAEAALKRAIVRLEIKGKA